MQEQTPAATMELTDNDAHLALMKDERYRHHEIDALADFYQHIYGALVAAGHNPDEVGRVLTDSTKAELAQLRDDIRAFVLNQHEHAVRWTLDPYDEMDE